MNTPLKKLRESRGISQAEVAKAVKIDQATYSKVENAIHCPRPATAAALVKFFGGTINELQIIYPARYKKFQVAPE